jgi:hypothetical protein
MKMGRRELEKVGRREHGKVEKWNVKSGKGM